MLSNDVLLYFSLIKYLNTYTAINLYETLKTVMSVQLHVFCFVDFALGGTVKVYGMYLTYH